MTALARVPVRRILHAIADASARWSDADFPPRVRLLDRIVERTGYTVPVVEYALDQLFFSLTLDALEATVANELGSIDALDGFVKRPGRPRGFAVPLGSVCVISSRTTIGVAIVPAVFALCAKCDVLVKDREDHLVRAFFATLERELDEFAHAASEQTWEGPRDQVDPGAFDAVVAFGNDATLARIRERCSARATFIGYGSKSSIGYVARESLESEERAKQIAEGAARDLVLYETEGCLSLHALFVERGGAVDPQQFSAMLASAVERAAVEFPQGRRDARATAQLAHARDLAAFRAAGGAGRVFSDANASYLAVLDPPSHEPPAFLPRALAIHTVDGPAEARAYLQRHEIPLEALAVAGARDDIVNTAVEMGVHRITSFGELQRPPLAGNHGGRPRIAEFVRWISREA
jgi:hypothetical protein